MKYNFFRPALVVGFVLP